MQHFRDIVGTLNSFSALESGRFLVDGGSTSRGDRLEEKAEGDFADIMGQFVMHLLAARQRRLLQQFYGWPGRMLQVLGTDEAAQRTIAEFQDDLKVWQAFQRLGDMSAHEATIERRHLFNLLASQQYIEGFQCTGFCMT